MHEEATKVVKAQFGSASTCNTALRFTNQVISKWAPFEDQEQDKYIQKLNYVCQRPSDPVLQ